jgi:hypothetical protein
VIRGNGSAIAMPASLVTAIKQVYHKIGMSILHETGPTLLSISTHQVNAVQELTTNNYLNLLERTTLTSTTTMDPSNKCGCTVHDQVRSGICLLDRLRWVVYYIG